MSELVRGTLLPHGLEPWTVGRNASSPDQVDDAIEKLLGTCSCLVGLATARMDAVDVDTSGRKTIATPYLLQETAMAFQMKMPFLILVAEGVELQGVTGRNLYLPIHRDLKNGRIRFRAGRELVEGTFEDLKVRAKAFEASRRSAAIIDGVAKVAAGAGALFLGIKAIEKWSQPGCFGEFHYKIAHCRDCSSKAECKGEKAKRQTRERQHRP